MKVLSVKEMKELESELDHSGVSYNSMMLNAGHNLADWIKNKFQEKDQKVILGLIGSGKNGSDTLISLTELISHGWFCVAYCIKPREHEDIFLRIFSEAGGTITTDIDQLPGLFSHSPLILDGIIGTGFHSPMEAAFENKLLMINQFISSTYSDPIIIAVDCPSGVNCDSGEVNVGVIKASFTACMGAVKPGLLKFPAFQFCGEFILIDIGIPEGFAKIDQAKSFVIDNKFILANINSRNSISHKGSFGKCAILAGSKKYPGAAFLAGKAAYLSGTGLVGILSSNDLKKQLSGFLPEVVWWELDQEFEDDEFPHSISAILVGPGLDHNLDSLSRFSKLIKYIRKFEHANPIPVVIDADGLRLLHNVDNWWKILPSTTILTPHPGEMAELTGLSTQEIESARWEIVKHYSTKWNKIVLLKGAISVVANNTGDIGIIPIATSALSTAGTGDILAGFITGLCAQGNEPFAASLMGAYIHAKAGLYLDISNRQTYTITASDILAAIPFVFSTLMATGNQT